MRNITKVRRSVRAISPVIAVLLMIAIAVVASIVVYAWIMGYLGTSTSKSGNAILIQSITATGSDKKLLVYVQNVGQGSVVVDTGYVNNELVTQSLSISIDKGETETVPTSFEVISDDILKVKIVTTDGTFAEYSGKAPYGNVQLNQVDFNLGAGGASMIPSGTQYYTTGTTIVVRAVASLGNQFLSWTSTGSITFDSTSSAITNAHIDGAGEITANFIAVQPTQNYQVSWILGQGGSSMNPSGTLTYAGGSAVPISAVPAAGYQFSYWSTIGSISFDSAISSTTIARINGQGSVTANFIATQPAQNYMVSWTLGQGGSSMSPTGTQTYAGGSAVSIYAIPDSGYQFSYWTSSTTSGSITFDSVTSATTTAYINGAGTVTANFNQIQTGQTYQVTFTTNGGGASSTTTPSGTQTYNAGQIVPISATEGSGYQFSSWSTTGSISFDSSTSASTNAAINGAGSIIANFIVSQPNQDYQVVFNLGVGGLSMTPTGTQTYAGGSIVPLSAVAASGYQFYSWISTGSISFDSSISSSTNAQINSAGSITANFIATNPNQNYQVAFNLGSGGASMSPTGTQTYASGSTVPITATPSTGYQFSSWTNTGTITIDSSTSSSTNAQINSAGSITANFEAVSQDYQVTFNLGAGGNSMSPTGTHTYPSGSTISVTASPSSNYHFSSWTSTGTITFDTPTSASTNAHITSAGTITANFEINKLHITATAGSNGQISPSGNVEVNYGANQAFTITPNNGYVVASLTVDGSPTGYGTSYAFTNVIADHTIAVTFTTGSTAINTGFDGATWDQGWMAGGNPPWYPAAGQGIGGTTAAKSDPFGSNSGAFTSDAMDMRGSTTIRITFMYKVINTDNNNMDASGDLRIAYCGRTTSTIPNLNPNSPDFTYMASIGRPAEDNVWYAGSLTLNSAANPTAFRQYFYFRFESDLETNNPGNLIETVWVDNVIITRSP